MEQALSGFNGQIIPSTSDEAPRRLAYVAPYLGAHHAPALFHVQQELVKAASGPLATKQRAASKAAVEAQARREQVQGCRPDTNDEPPPPGPACPPPKAICTLEQAQHDAQAASQEVVRIRTQREQVAQSIRRIGQAYHFVVAQTHTVSAGEPLRNLAERLRTPRFESGGALADLEPTTQNQLQHHAQRLGTVVQRSSSNVEGRNGYLSLRNHQLRGLDRP